MKSETGWEVEFGPGFSVPAIICKNPLFVDTSWGNDMAPTFSPVGFEHGAKIGITIWADHPDKAQREIETGKRFWVCLTVDGGYHEPTILETDDEIEAVERALTLAKMLEETK